MTLSLDLTADTTRATRCAPAPPCRRKAVADRPVARRARRGAGRGRHRAGAPGEDARAAALALALCARRLRFLRDVQHLQGSARRRSTEHFTIARPEIVEEQVSSDGTRKWLFRFPPRGAGRPVEIETVYIPEEGRGTLCISSQVGCTLTCSFCHTGTQKLVRNLTAEEILAQLLTARDRLGDFPDRDTPDGAIVPAEGRKISNIVMMGMGEPLYNFEEVKKALLIASDGDGLSLSKRRITLSTSGVVPEIFRTGDEIGVMLAISLHATNDDLRDLLVPINKKYPLKELIAACRAYPGLSNARRITFEYVMLKDVNDSHRRRQGAGASC